MQRLRKAGLVESRRGAHGGYTLARPAGGDHDGRGGAALEGEIAPIECITADADGVLVCSREGDESRPCPTKLLWTRVQGSIVRTLNEMTLADLVQAVRAPERRRQRPYDLEIQNLHVRTEEREILHGVDLVVKKGETHALMGPNGSGKSTLANTLMGNPNYEVTEGQHPARTARTSPRPTRTSAPAPACSWPSSTRPRSRASRSPTSCAWR